MELTEGTVYRDNGAVTITKGMETAMANGMLDTAGTGVTELPTGVQAAASIKILKDTKLGSDLIYSTDTDAKNAVFTLGAGLTTKAFLELTYSQYSLTVETSTEAWTGAPITVSGDMKTVTLDGQKIGPMTVDSTTKQAIAVGANGTEIWGTLTVNDWAGHSADAHSGGCTTVALTSAVVTQTGSIVLGENVVMTVNTGADVLGTVSGEGTIGSDDYSLIKTPDATTSNITVKDVSGKKVNSDPAEPTGVTTTAQVTQYATMGYTVIPIGTPALTVTQSYTIPEGVRIDASAYGIIIEPGTKDASVVLTLPSSSSIVLGDGIAIAVGYDADAGSKATDKWIKYASLVIEGELDGTGVVEGKGSFELASNGAVGSGVSVITTTASGNTKELKWIGDVLIKEIPVYQKVIIPEGETATIEKLREVKFYGELQVDGTLVVSEKSTILFGLEDKTTKSGSTTNDITYTPQAAKITVSSTGSIQIKENSTMNVVNASGTLSGPVQVDGTLKMANSSSLTVKSTMTESSTGVIGMDGASTKISVASSGSLTINGYLGMDGYTDATIANSGAVVIDNSSIETRETAKLGSATISLTANKASVTIDSYVIEGTSGNFSKLTINDKGLALNKFGNTTYYAGTGSDSGTKVYTGELNTYEITGAAKDVKVTGKLVVTEELSSYAYDTALSVSNRMLLSGSLSNGTSGENPAAITATMTASASASATITDTSSAYKSATFTPAVAVAKDTTLTIGKYVSQVNKGVFQVDGYVDMTADGVTTISNSSGTINVPGMVKIKDVEISGGTINAVKYVSKEAVGSSTATFYVYTSLDQAVEDILAETNTNTDKTITIYGIVNLNQSVEIKEPIQVKFATSNAATNKLNVGSSSNTDVVLAFDEGTKFTSAKNQVDVYGTLYFADKTNDATNKTICDVKVESDDSVDRMYTNIYTALASAESGDTVVVTRDAADANQAEQFVQLTKSVTVGDGVTLKVASNVAALRLANGVTLTINGTLDSAKDVYAQRMFGVTASLLKNEESSAVVVNGTVKGFTYEYKAGEAGSDKGMSEGAPIAGAYYNVSGTNYLSTVEVAEKNFSKVGGAVKIYGPVTAGDLSFAKTSSSTGTSVEIYGVDVGTTKTSLTASSITIDEVSVVVKYGGKLNATVKNDSASVIASKIGGADGSDLVIIDKSGALSLYGTAAADKNSALTVSTGTVKAGTSSDDGSFMYTTTADNALTVASGATLEAENMDIDKLTVQGTFSVPQSKSASVGILVDLGTVSVFAGSETSSGSTLTVKYLWIGTSSDETHKTAASASFAGPVEVTGYAVVKSGASVDSDAQKVLSKITKKTEFYVSNALWITVYAKSDVAITYFDNPVITNAYFAGWYNADGEAADPDKGDDKNVGDTDFEKVYASILTKVYHVEIKADQGIGDLYLNGNIMSKGFKINNTSSTSDSEYYYAYWADVEAGDYEVTCKLANGYGGTAVLKNTDGSVVSNNKFTASGTPETSAGINLNFQLTGIAKTGYVQPSEDKDDDTGMGITDYLLIVLVILVVVLAVIVALRLMRS